MTTIAWDGTHLAADQKCSDEGGFQWRCYKIRRAFDGRLMGACGGATLCVLAMDWLEKGGDLSNALLQSDDWEAMEIRRDGTIWLHDQHGPDQVRGNQHAIGSGRKYAITAMYLGLSAERAVEVAAQFDPSTGLGVDVLRLKAASPQDSE